MADRPKKKQASGVRNDSRANGKAPKKNPKPQHTVDPAVKARRDKFREALRIQAEQAEAERHARYNTRQAPVGKTLRVRSSHIGYVTRKA